MSPVLDARLAAAAALVRPGHRAADIGCDHGLLTAALVGSGRCPFVVAADLRSGPLSVAANHGQRPSRTKDAVATAVCAAEDSARELEAMKDSLSQMRLQFDAMYELKKKKLTQGDELSGRCWCYVCCERWREWRRHYR